MAGNLARRAGRGRRLGSWLGWHIGDAGGETPRLARLRSGSTMLVDAREHAHREILLYGVYEPDLTALLRRLAAPGWTVLDVGANAGYFSLLATDLGGPGSRVIAFEPQPPVAAMLRRTVILNATDAITVVEAACGDHDGVARLSASPDPRNTGLASLRPPTGGRATTEVSLLRLDRFCADQGLRPDLVKIDVEGAEEGVLRGAEELLAAGLPRHVLCELWPESRDGVIEYMSAHGYEAFGIGPDGSLGEIAGGASWSNVCFRAGPAPGTNA